MFSLCTKRRRTILRRCFFWRLRQLEIKRCDRLQGRGQVVAVQSRAFRHDPVFADRFVVERGDTAEAEAEFIARWNRIPTLYSAR